MMIKLQNLKRKLCLLLLSFCMAGVLVAQNSNEQQKLQGKWLLEEASILKIEGRDSIVMSIETLEMADFDVTMHVLPELEFHGDSLNVIFPDSEFMGQVYINHGQLRYDLLPMPINIDFNVTNSKLILHKLYTSHNRSVFDIVLIYHKD